MEKMTAAHRTLPFNTWVRVTNMANGKTVEVRITDRGPFVEGRVIDLSKAAARQLELLGPGVGPVRLEVIRPPALPQELAAMPLPVAAATAAPSVPITPPPAPSVPSAQSAPAVTPLVTSESTTSNQSVEPALTTPLTALNPAPEPELYAVQIGAFSVLENAQRIREQFARYGDAQLVPRQGPQTIWRVLVGRFTSAAAAQGLATQLRDQVGHAVFVVHLDPPQPAR
jgi:rare lipoprotein A